MKNGLVQQVVISGLVLGVVMTTIWALDAKQDKEIKELRVKNDTIEQQLREFEIQLTKIETILTLKFAEEAQKADSIIMAVSTNNGRE